MGQQQLLLLVLATVIVGLATVAGIQAFEQGSVRANQDALTQQAVKIASDIQANLKEPSQFGGQGVSDWSSYSADGNITLETLGYSTSSSSNVEGLSAPVYDFSQGECAITQNGSTPLQVTCESGDATVTVDVDGLNSDDVSTSNLGIKS